MNKEQLFENLDYQEGDKIYIVRIREAPEGTNCIIKSAEKFNCNPYTVIEFVRSMQEHLKKYWNE